MSTYRLIRSDVFCFDQQPEIILQLPDFEIAERKTTAITVRVANAVIPMRIVGMGNQKGKLAIHLAAADSSLIEHIRGAEPNDEVLIIG